jgi:hypothetical protein
VKLCEREGCGITFEPVRSTARFCSARCRVAAGRAEVKAAARTLERAGQFADYDEDNPYLTQVALTAAAKVAYPCCQHCPDRPHAAHADPCRQGCPA